MKKLTKAEIAALKTVKHGADVYAYDLAARLRQIEKKHPALISIGRPQMYKGSGVDQMPYFGAICTKAGRAAIAKAETP